MLKDLIIKKRIVTTVEKAKFLKRYADKIVTLAKKGTIDARRQVKKKLMLRYNYLNSKEKRLFKNGDNSVANNDRFVLNKLFDVLGPRFVDRNGGYTTTARLGNRVGDNAAMCAIAYLDD
jgi:large subunit ribosomal protein L17